MISQRIKEVRIKNNLSQTDFGKKLGVSRDVISNIEYGRVEPKEIFIDHLCYIFSINKDWLETGKGPMEDHTIETQKNIEEAIKIIENLPKDLQDYAIEQLKSLKKLEKHIK